MKKILIITIVLLCTSSMVFADYNGNVTTNETELSFSQMNDYDFISFKKDYFTEEVGAPQLPVKILKYVIPIDMNVTDITINSSEQIQLSGTYNIYPAQPPYPLDFSDPPPFVEPNSEIYDSSNPYPDKLVEVIADEFTMGYHIVTLRFYTVEYIPAEQKINLYTNIDFTIEYKSNPQPIQLPLRQSAIRQKLVESFIKSSVENPGDFESVTGGAQEIIPEKTEMQEMDLRFMPSLEGNTPDYIIITNEELKPIFDELAAWKIKKGIPTLVVTTEQILDNYSGCDLAEKIRNYLIEAFNYWGGGLFVLLGGDTNIIPARLAISNGTLPTDLYYATVEGNWNDDGDNIFGEGSDDVDYGYDHFLGRASVEDTTETHTFVNKILYYEKLNEPTIDINYVKNVLLLGAFYWVNTYPEGQTIHHNVDNNYLPSHINSWRIFDDHTNNTGNNPYWGHEELNRDNVLAAMNDGGNSDYNYFHIISHYDHGNPYVIGTSAKSKNQNINRTDMDNLINCPYYHILFTHSCSPNQFQKDCFGEHYINAPNGGGVAFIGNSGSADAFGQRSRFYEFFDHIYNLPDTDNGYILGHAFQASGLTIYNTLRKKFNLLGDPEMPVWSNTPAELIVDITPSEITNGENTITVTINDLATNVTARVCLQKDNEAYGFKTVVGEGLGTEVSVLFNLILDTCGEDEFLDVTVTAHNYFPYEDTIPVNLTSGSHLYITEKTFDDDNVPPSYGNNDGQVDAGETIELSITLTNSGSADALDVSSELTTDSDYIIITQNQSNFGDINAGESAVSQINYIFEVDPDTPDGEYVCDTLLIYEGTVLLHTDVFYLQIGAPELDQVKNTIDIITGNGDDIIDAGETVELSIDLFNTGNAEATGITSSLSPDCQYIESITEPDQTYDNIAPLSVQTNLAPFVFIVSSDYPGSPTSLDFILTVTNEYEKEWEFSFNLDKPESVDYDKIDFAGYLNEIDLWWDPIDNIRGYNIYRDFDGTYEKLNTFIIEGTSYYKDTGLEPVTSYFYKISAVTESGNESYLTAPYEAWTTLPYHAGWPVSSDVGNNIHGSVNVYDIYCDGQQEVFTTIGGGGGYILGFQSNGEELFDIDSNPTTVSGFIEFDSGILGTPAVGDIDNDGIAEVVVSTSSGGDDEKKVFVYKTIDNNGDGKPDLLWEASIGQSTWRCPVISDIDNDGDIEVIASGQNGVICVFDHTGIILPNSEWPKQIPGNSCSYGMPAVADLNNDGNKEIIISFRSGELYIWNYDGTDFSEINPIFTIEDKLLVVPPVIVDLDNDGDYEILIVASQTGSANVYALHDNGDYVTGWEENEHEIPLEYDSNNWARTEPPAIAVGDLDGDMDIEVVIGGYEYLSAWHHDGNILNENFPINIPGLNVWASAPLLADINEDPYIEIIMASRDKNIHAYNHDGTRVTGWPLKTDDIITASPCIRDIDNDGKSELIAGNYSGKTYVWDTEGDANKIEWSSYRNNSHNTGVYNGSTTISGTLSHDETWMENVFITGNVIVPSGITLTVDNSCRVYLTGNGTLTVEDGGTLNIKNWSRIQGICSENRIEVYGNITTDDNVAFTAPEGKSWDGLYLLNADAEVIMNNVTFERCKLHNESLSLDIVNSHFTNSGIEQLGNVLLISNSAFDESVINCNYLAKAPLPTPLPEINISGCSFINSYGYAVSITNYLLYTLHNNTITNCSSGFYIAESGYPNQCIISDNHIYENLGAGIFIYHSYANICDDNGINWGQNVIMNNLRGILGLNKSSITIIGNPDYPHSTIQDNEAQELYFDPSSFPEKICYNKIIDDNYINGSVDQYLIHCKNYTGGDRKLIVEDNYWGEESENWVEWTGDHRFSPSEAFDYIPVWIPGPPVNPPKGTGAKGLYADADSLIQIEEYEAAKQVYRNIINLYPESKYPIFSMRNLLPLETVSGQNFTSLKEYYLTDPNCNYDSERTKLSSYLANHCNIKLENYPDAITFFEDIIADPDTELDSVYAVIDAGYTYLLMGDGDGKSTYIGRMPELKPKSVLKFEEMRDKLLAKALGLPEQDGEETIPENVFYLGQNYPNPMRSLTNISFSIPKDAKNSEIKIYNIKGQLVKQLSIGNSKSSIEWDGKDENGNQLSTGIYLYKLIIDNNKSIIKKMVLLR